MEGDRTAVRKPLEGLRVIDWAGQTAPHCGQILSLFGADVVLVERTGAQAARADLSWAAFNAGKRSLALDLGQPEDRARLEALARQADVWIDSGGPLLTGFEPQQIATGLIHASITPFGLEGPRAHWVDNELVAQAAGGILYLSGNREHPPAQIGISLATGMAGAQAACAVLLALEHRRRTGVALRIDVSRQESVANLLFTTQFMSLVSGHPGQRGAAPLTASGKKLTRKILWECADGFATWTLWTGTGLGAKNALTFGWMRDAGVPDADKLLEVPWERMSTGDLTPELIERVETAVGGFFRGLPKAVIDREAFARRILLAAVQTPEDLFHSEQLRVREAFRTFQLPDDRKVEIVATPVRSTAYPVEIGPKAPAWGEHNHAVLREWGHRAPSRDDVRVGRGRALRPNGGLPLAGVRIVDLGWAVVSPLATKYLAMFGADVVKVEVRSRPDPVRMTGPYPRGRPSFDGSSTFVSINASKRSIGIDLETDAGRALLRKLARHADVVCENFTPGTAARLGCDDATLRRERPDLITLSISLQGQTGPFAVQPGLGNHLQAKSGIDYLTGFPDGIPGGPNQVLPDFIGSWVAIAALLTALEHRRKTGEGQFIDLGQLEAIMLYVQPHLITYALSGVCPERHGNASPTAAPHGVYPVRGEDQWIAIAVEDDAAWHELHAQLPEPLRARFAASLDTSGRLSVAAELDSAIAEWTARCDGEALMAELQSRGVAAYVVCDGMQLVADPQLAHRQHYRGVRHGKLGDQWADAPSFRFDGLEPRITAGPRYAEHTAEVLREWLGLDEDAIAQLVASGALVF